MHGVNIQGNAAQARACYFDVANKWGAFASMPLTAGHSVSPVFGVRYSSPLLTAGGMVSPTDSKVHCLWLVSLHPDCYLHHSECLKSSLQISHLWPVSWHGCQLEG